MLFRSKEINIHKNYNKLDRSLTIGRKSICDSSSNNSIILKKPIIDTTLEKQDHQMYIEAKIKNKEIDTSSCASHIHESLIDNEEIVIPLREPYTFIH